MTYRVSAFCFLLSALLANAQPDSAPVGAEISVSKTQLYERETFQITLTIKTMGVQIRQKLDLENLPDKRQVDMFTSFETLPTQRVADGHRITEIRRYRCQARALTPGTVRIEPTLRLVAMRRRRLFIGSAWEEFPLKVTIAPIELTVKTLPPPPADFSGAIGKIATQASIDPTDIAPGDLVTLRTRISGNGYMEGMRIPQVEQRTEFKVYAPKRVHSDANSRIYEQIIIPQTTNTTAIPAVALTYFDTDSGAYSTTTRGPFPITFHAATEAPLQHFRPTDTPPPPPQIEPPAKPSIPSRIHSALGRARYKQGTCNDTTQAHMAPSANSMVTFELPAASHVDILQHHIDWLLIESDLRRAWIPQSSLQEQPQN